MRQIADVRAGALDNLAIGFDECIGLARKRLDLDGKAALEALGGAGADRGKARGNALERGQAKTHLEHCGEEEHHAENGEGRDESVIKGDDLVVDLEGVAGDRYEIAPVIAEIDG